MEPVRILLVDHHPVFRYGLQTLLLNEEWVEEVVEASTAAEGKRRAGSHQFDLVAMDPTIPGGDGVDFIRTLRQANPNTKVLVFTMAEDDELVAEVLRAGAFGVVSKFEEPEVIIDALRTILRGAIVLGPSVASAMLRRWTPVARRLPINGLTEREHAILALLASAKTNAQIARHLGVSEKTIRNHLSNIFSKLGVADRLQAGLVAREAGLMAAPGE